jgi:hypothetical protein
LTSWVIGCAFSKSGTDLNTAPTGMTNIAVTTSNRMGCHSTGAPVTGWSTQTTSINASDVWQSYVMEVKACITPVCYLNVSGGFSGGSSSTVATGATPHGAGVKLILVVRNDTTGTNTSSVANTAGDTWALCTGTRQSTVKHIEIWETTSTPNGNAADIVTATLAANDTNKLAFVFAVSGVSTGACQSAAIASCSSCTTVTSGTFTPARDGNFTLAAGNQTNAATFTAGTGYVLNIGTDTAAEHKIGTAAGAQTAAITMALSNNIGFSVASFQSSAVFGQQIGGFLVGP